jgi:hypothetical protein
MHTLLTWQGGVVCFIAIALLCLCAMAWCLYQLGHTDRLKKIGRQIHTTVYQHLENGISQARPVDCPGADPDTMMLKFSREQDGAVVICRIDWDGHKKRYIIAKDGSIARKTDPCRNRADLKWSSPRLTRKRCKALSSAVAYRYQLASSRYKGDTTQPHGYTLACLPHAHSAANL